MGDIELMCLEELDTEKKYPRSELIKFVFEWGYYYKVDREVVSISISIIDMILFEGLSLQMLKLPSNTYEGLACSSLLVALKFWCPHRCDSKGRSICNTENWLYTWKYNDLRTLSIAQEYELAVLEAIDWDVATLYKECLHTKLYQRIGTKISLRRQSYYLLFMDLLIRKLGTEEYVRFVTDLFTDKNDRKYMTSATSTYGYEDELSIVISQLNIPKTFKADCWTHLIQTK